MLFHDTPEHARNFFRFFNFTKPLTIWRIPDHDAIQSFYGQILHVALLKLNQIHETRFHRIFLCYFDHTWIHIRACNI